MQCVYKKEKARENRGKREKQKKPATATAVADAAPSRSPSKDAAKAVLQWVAPVPGRRCVDCGERGG